MMAYPCVSRLTALCRVGYTWSKQQGFDSVRVLKLAHNMGKVRVLKRLLQYMTAIDVAHVLQHWDSIMVCRGPDLTTASPAKALQAPARHQHTCSLGPLTLQQRPGSGQQGPQAAFPAG